MADACWARYEQRKAAWIAAHPAATPEEYEQAAIREFRGDELRMARLISEKRDCPRLPCVPSGKSMKGNHA